MQWLKEKKREINPRFASKTDIIIIIKYVFKFFDHEDNRIKQSTSSSISSIKKNDCKKNIHFTILVFFSFVTLPQDKSNDS